MSKPVALVTGGASGIGLALTKHLLSKGYRVVIGDLNEQAGTQVQKELGPDTLFHRADISIYAEQAALFKHAFAWGGNRLDFFAANAGTEDKQDLHSSTQELDENGDLKPLNLKAMDVNLTSVIQGLWIFKYYARQNPTPGGKVVITASIASFYPHPINPQYTVSKHALMGLTRSVGPVYLAKENITVNSISPAFIATNLCPPKVLNLIPKEKITPMSTAIKAYDAFLNADTMTGQTTELTLDEVLFRKVPEFGSENIRWWMEDAGKIWEEAYAET